MNEQCDLYGWDVSPYTEKVKKYFEYKEIPYRYVNPSIITLSRKIKAVAGKWIMPVVFDHDGTVTQDSTVIINHYENLFPDKPIFPQSPKIKILCMMVELFGDEWLPMASLHYRWNYPENYDFIMSEFGSNALPYMPKFIQRKAASKLGKQLSGYLPKLGITEKTKASFEVTVEKLLGLLDAHFEQHSYLFGGQPTLADFSVYGQLYAHLHRDPYPENLISKRANLMRWVDTMNNISTSETSGKLFDDEVPEMLVTLLNFLFNLQAPLLRQSIASVTEWSSGQESGTRVPGRINEAEIVFDGVTEKRYNTTYPYWMFQQVQDTYFAMDSSELTQVNSLLQQLNIADLFEARLTSRVDLRKTRLYLQ